MKNTDEKMGHENVLLLAMSTLPTDPKMNTYTIEKEDLYFKSLSQMEPHTKYILYMLAERKEKLDRIVILASEKARTEKPEKWQQETAVSLFTKRIHSYLGGTESVGIIVEDELADLKESVADFQIYQGGFPGIITIDLEETVFFWKAVQAIRSKGGNCSVHLYMDMQGGDRNAVSQMNAIAELLERQKVTIKGRFANNFDPRRTPPLHTIREASREYRTYDLISAMDIFAQYGWGDKLEQYFKGMVEKDSRESRLIEAIKLASSSISRCDVEGFDTAVKKIEKLQPEYENPQTVTEMDVVYQDIREDYAPLFDARYRYVAQIRWCLKKNFLQQAWTIFEAKMPYEFVHSGLIYYMTKEKEKDERKEFMEKCEKLYVEMPEKDRYRMKDLNHYLVKDYCWDHKKGCFQDPWQFLVFGLQDAQKEETLTLLNKYRELCRLRNKMNHAAEETHDPDGFFCYMQKKGDHNWMSPKTKKKTDYREKLRSYLDRWQTLADQVSDKIREQVVDLS